MNTFLPMSLFFVLLFVGCESTLPVYDWRGSATALEDLHERSAKLHSASGTATMTLHRADGASVRVDSAFAMKQPDSLRIRAWKMDRAVADWTLRRDGIWVWQAETADQPPTSKQAGPWSAHHRDIWPMLFGMLEQRAGDEIIDDDGSDLHVRRPIGDAVATVTIDKRSLVVRECRIVDSRGELLQSVTLKDYRLMDGFLWPMHVSARGAAGAFELRFDEVTINEEPPANAFDPPARARLIP